jgi:sialidase-1
MSLKQIDLFIHGEHNYHTYRIPALIVSKKGTLLAFAEGRKHGIGDSGEIDLVVKRSIDQGVSWEALQLVVSEPGMTCGNPCPVVDHKTGIIWLPFCKNNADDNERRIIRGKATRTIWVTHSKDDGITWAEPVEITKDVKDPSWTWYATGPTHGIQLHNKRLIIPCDHMVGKSFSQRRDSYHSHIIFSDDNGTNWNIGGIVEKGTNECVVVELVDGSIYINCRNYIGNPRRAVAWSHDQGESFGQKFWDETLIEPICQASLVRFTDETQHDRNRILFSNPASISRENLTIRLSYDECQTWSVAKTLNAGPSAYSDLTVTHDGTIYCLYECGDKHPYEKLRMASFDLVWLTNGDDKA